MRWPLSLASCLTSVSDLDLGEGVCVAVCCSVLREVTQCVTRWPSSLDSCFTKAYLSLWRLVPFSSLWCSSPRGLCVAAVVAACCNVLRYVTQYVTRWPLSLGSYLTSSLERSMFGFSTWLLNLGLLTVIWGSVRALLRLISMGLFHMD